MGFANKTALITGAASGMGYLTGKCFVQEGGNAVLTDINLETLETAVSNLNKIRPGSAIGAVCDVRDYAQVCNARDKAVEHFGSIDLLVTMAGGAETRILHAQGEFPDIPIEVYDWGMDVNLKGQFYFDHAVARQMREQKSGVIINIGSITGEEGSPDAVAYSVSKSAAMNGLVKSVAQFGHAPRHPLLLRSSWPGADPSRNGKYENSDGARRRTAGNCGYDSVPCL